MKRLETLMAPPPTLPEIVVQYLNTMTHEIEYTLHVKNGQSEYRTADGKLTTLAEIARQAAYER